MKTRKLHNITVSEIGMGCMGFSHGYGEIPRKITRSMRFARLMISAARSLTLRKFTALTFQNPATMN